MGAMLIIAIATGSQHATSALAQATPDVSVGAQYDSTHVYVDAGDFDRSVTSFSATFGGTTSKKGTFDVTATPSETMSQIALSPFGTISVFGFTTPIPYPFGLERMGFLVTDMDAAIAAARENGAAIVVAPFDDPIGRDAIVEWPGGVYMQLYRHTSAPHYGALTAEPENRVYVSSDDAEEFVRSFDGFSHGTVVSDDTAAAGIEIGRPADRYRRIRLESAFGKMTVLVTDGHLPYPYGRETTGYDVPDLVATLAKAAAAGATVLVSQYVADGRAAAIVRFPGGYVAEIHEEIR